MKYRKLGRTGFEVSDIGYGAWGISGAQWIGATDDESLAALRLAIELGLNFIDTALAYGDGHSEQLVGRIVREAGRRIYIATKVPPKNRLWPARPGVPIGQVFPEEYIVECAERSLCNLATDCLDLLQLHVWNPEWIASDAWRNAFARLKTAGKVRAVGVSINDHQPDTALELIDTGLIDTVQVIYNVFDQSPERLLFPKCQENGIGVLARVPFDEGSLTGNITASTTFPAGDFRNFYFQGDRKRQVEARVDALVRDLGIERSRLPEMALRFCISSPAVTSAIPGMRSRRNVEANCKVSDLGPLPPDVLSTLQRHAWDRNFYA
jgi:aryl-alcohol dehydrogenase-like predicted oxidoreductase